MILRDIGMLAVDSNRSKFYLLQLIKHEMLPSFVLLMEDPSISTPEAIAKIQSDNRKERVIFESFDLTLSLRALLKKNSIPYRILSSLNPNSNIVVSAVADSEQSIFIYSGPGGAILRKQILGAGKRFLHVHPGIVPHYRGSTTIYYSLLKEGNCGATAFFLNEQIDMGPVIRKKIFKAPQDRQTIDLFYDPFIRSELLVEVLKTYTQTGVMSSEADDIAAGETYFIIHPVLKHISITSDENKK